MQCFPQIKCLNVLKLGENQTNLITYGVPCVVDTLQEYLTRRKLTLSDTDYFELQKHGGIGEGGDRVKSGIYLSLSGLYHDFKRYLTMKLALIL